MERRRMHDSSKDPKNHFCYFSLWKDPTLQPAKLKSSWGYGLWLGRSQTSNAHFIPTRVVIVVARTIRRLSASEREDPNLVVAMKGTLVAGRPAVAAAGDAPTVTRHAVEQRVVVVVPANSGAPLQAGSGEGVSASSNPVPNLPSRQLRGHNRHRLQRTAAIIQVVSELTVLDLVVTCLWRWHKLWNQQRNHTPRLRSTMRVSFQAKSGITRIHSWLSRLRRTQLQTFAEESTETS